MTQPDIDLLSIASLLSLVVVHAKNSIVILSLNLFRIKRNQNSNGMISLITFLLMNSVSKETSEILLSHHMFPFCPKEFILYSLNASPTIVLVSHYLRFILRLHRISLVDSPPITNHRDFDQLW